MGTISVDRVIERLTRRHPTLVLNKADVADYCFDVVEESGLYHSFDEVVMALPIEGGRAQLPCNMYRLLNVFYGCDTCRVPRYAVSGAHLNLPLTYSGNILVQALVFKVDEEGYAQIDETLERACYWYVLREKMRDPMMQGDYPANLYAELDPNYRHELRRARGSMRHMTREDMSGAVNILRSMVITGPVYRGGSLHRR